MSPTAIFYPDSGFGPSLFPLSALTSVSATIGNMASFSLSQVMLQLTNSWLDVFGQTLRVAGVKEENMFRKKVMKMHSTTKTILKMGKEKAGEDIEKKI